jgi:SAM-dependent methyltransferase
MERDDIAGITAANKAAWDASAPMHGAGKDWEDLLAAAGQPGFSVLDACLTETLAALDLRGRRVVQPGCNNARELLSMASFGAVPALGIDQSPAFLAQGAQLAAAAGLAPRLLEADLYALPAGLGRHDLCLITIGVLGWMPDLGRFFEIVAGLLEPGGQLVIYETHPFLDMFEPGAEDPFRPHYSYFDRSAQPEEGAITYDGTQADTGLTHYWMTHTLGEIVTATIAAGLLLERLTEHPQSNREVEFDIYEGQPAQIPMSFTLVARRG